MINDPQLLILDDLTQDNLLATKDSPGRPNLRLKRKRSEASQASHPIICQIAPRYLNSEGVSRGADRSILKTEILDIIRSTYFSWFAPIMEHLVTSLLPHCKMVGFISVRDSTTGMRVTGYRNTRVLEGICDGSTTGIAVNNRIALISAISYSY